MADNIADFWNPRFAAPGYAYGEAPNDFLRDQAGRLSPASRVLSLGEGEGRNALHLATLGHQVTAVDASHVGLSKLLTRAAAANLSVTTTLADLANYAMTASQWDAVISIFCHLPSPLRQQVLADSVAALRPGGLLIMEGYTPRQLAFDTGGPKERDMLLEPAEIEQALRDMTLLHFAEVERDIHEGRYHTGHSAVLQVVARKPA